MNIQYPRTEAQVQHIVQHSKRLRVLGHRHSFSKIGDSDCTLLDTLGLNAFININPAVPSVTVQPGIIYTDLCPLIGKLKANKKCKSVSFYQKP
jgi:xylitol oxidase